MLMALAVTTNTSTRTADRVKLKRRIFDRDCPTSKSVPKTRNQRKIGCKPTTKPFWFPIEISKQVSPAGSPILPNGRSGTQCNDFSFPCCCYWVFSLMTRAGIDCCKFGQVKDCTQHSFTVPLNGNQPFHLASFHFFICESLICWALKTFEIIGETWILNV